MFQPTELNRHRLMLFTNCVTPLIHKQEINTLSTSTERIKRTHINTHTYRTVFVLSDSPLKVVRLCSWSALSTRLCPQSTHMHKHKHTHTIAESWESKLWCDYIFFKDCLLLLFKLCVFRRVFNETVMQGQRGRFRRTRAQTKEFLFVWTSHPLVRSHGLRRSL